MRDARRVARAILDAALAVDRRTTLLAFALALASWLTMPLTAVALQVFVDALTQTQLAPALGAAVLMAVFGISSEYTFSLRHVVGITLHEKTVHELDRRLQRVVSEVEGIEHLERPEYLDRIATLRAQSYWFGNIGSVLEVPAATLNVVITSTLLVSLDPVLLLVPLAVLPSIYLTGIGERRMRTAEERVATPGRMRRRMLELATSPAAAAEARLFEAGRGELDRHDAADRLIRGTLDRAAASAVFLGAIGWASIALAFGIALVYVATGVREGRFGLGQLFLLFVLVRGIGWQSQWALGAVSSLLRTVTATRNYLWLLDYAQRPSTRGAPRIALHEGGPLQFEGVSFRYPGTEHEVLSDVTFVVPAGSTLAIVGDNGAGKTTIVKLLARYYEPDGGRIRLGTVDVSQVEVQTWRAALSGCLQDFSRFEFRVRETIGVGQLDAIGDVGRVAEAADAAGAREVVEGLPAGLETQLGGSWDEGAEPSVGQWQKLALARAMMRQQPRLLLLDEPTASLDSAAEARLFERYAAATAFARATGSITIIVSHRMSTVRMADLVAVVDAGRLIEFGTHAALMRLDGAYRRLYDTQASAYAD